MLKEHVAAKKIAKKAVARAQQCERKRLEEKFKIAKQMAKERQDMV